MLGKYSGIPRFPAVLPIAPFIFWFSSDGALNLVVTSSDAIDALRAADIPGYFVKTIMIGWAQPML